MSFISWCLIRSVLTQESDSEERNNGQEEVEESDESDWNKQELLHMISTLVHYCCFIIPSNYFGDWLSLILIGKDK